MVYYKKIFWVLFFCFLFLFFSKKEAFCTVFYINGTSYDTSVFASNLPSDYNIDDFFVADNTNGYYCFFLRKDFTGEVKTNISTGGDRIYTSNGSKWQAYLDRNGFYKENVYSSGTNFRGVVFSTRPIYNENGSVFYEPNSISFTNASYDLSNIADGSDSTIEIEIFNYLNTELPSALYLSFYKKVGSNYNIYSIPVYIYEQYPSYVQTAVLNNDMFLFVDKSKMLSMGISFASDDEFYLFLSDRVDPKGSTTWNNNGTGILLGYNFKNTDANIYDESGLITIPTLSDEQEQINQSQSQSQAQIDAINDQTSAINDQTSAINQQTSAINQQTDAINQQTQIEQDTNGFLKNDSINDNNINLPSTNTTDVTENGVSNIFTAIYNGLTTGNAVDIVLPFPFTNKSITIPANYTETFLTSSAFSPIYTIIQAFYWYVIGRFIIKDISSKFEKIKSGDIENIENNNIKADML